MTLPGQNNLQVVGAGFSQIEHQILGVIQDLDFAEQLKEIPRDLDLYDAGMSSHTSVKLMLGVEDSFDIEFPDELLERETFSSIANIARSVEEILASG